MKFFIILFTYCALYFHTEASNNLSDVFVQLKNNQQASGVFGIRQLDWLDGEYYSFRGIPFAQPPVGPLRFKDPKPLSKYPANIDARYDGHDCPSIYATNASEDCLTLNVYTKELHPSKPLPVLVFIHPGGFYIGSSLSTFMGPEYLLTMPVVVVTFNHRLGSLGFMNLNSSEVPGNAGLKDQVFAMRWVKQYISSFGGNPEDITLAGYSAGGLSVTQHLVSPMSKGLFAKAIIMSGSLPPQTILSHEKEQALINRQLELLGCNMNGGVMECLNRFEGKEITAPLRKMFAFGKDNPIYLWLPSIETDFGQERFLTKDYWESVKAGEYEKVPLLIGFVDGEFCTSAAEIIADSKLEHDFYEKFDSLAPKIFMYDGQPMETEITQAIRKQYLSDSSFGNSNLTAMCDIFSDGIIRFGLNYLATLTAKNNPVYSYKFKYRGEFTNLPNITKVDNPRVEHVDDLMYLFHMRDHLIKPDSMDGKMVQLFVNFIFDFMLNGKPQSAEALEYPQNYALIQEDITYVKGLNFDIAEFWNGILENELKAN